MNNYKDTLIRAKRSDGDWGDVIVREDAPIEDARDGLRRSRTVAEGKADAAALADALGVSEAQAVRGAVAWALRKLEAIA